MPARNPTLPQIVVFGRRQCSITTQRGSTVIIPATVGDPLHCHLFVSLALQILSRMESDQTRIPDQKSELQGDSSENKEETESNGSGDLHERSKADTAREKEEREESEALESNELKNSPENQSEGAGQEKEIEGEDKEQEKEEEHEMSDASQQKQNEKDEDKAQINLEPKYNGGDPSEQTKDLSMSHTEDVDKLAKQSDESVENKEVQDKVEDDKRERKEKRSKEKKKKKDKKEKKGKLKKQKEEDVPKPDTGLQDLMKSVFGDSDEEQEHQTATAPAGPVDLNSVEGA